MFLRRRRPLMGAAMIGGTAYAAHKAGERSATAAQQAQEAAPPPPAAAPPPPAAPAGGGTDVVAQLQQLSQLKDQGVLSPEEFETAKQKLLAGG